MCTRPCYYCLSTGVSINVTPYNTLAVTKQDATFQFRQLAGPVTVATFTDSLGASGWANPSTYFGTLAFGTQSYPVTFNGNQIQAANLSSLSIGSHSGTIVAADASSGAQAGNS